MVINRKQLIILESLFPDRMKAFIQGCRGIPVGKKNAEFRHDCRRQLSVKDVPIEDQRINGENVPLRGIDNAETGPIATRLCCLG